MICIYTEHRIRFDGFGCIILLEWTYFTNENQNGNKNENGNENETDTQIPTTEIPTILFINMYKYMETGVIVIKSFSRDFLVIFITRTLNLS